MGEIVADSDFSFLRSTKTVAALEAVGSPVAVVIRQGANSKSEDGNTQTIKTDDVVP